MTQVRRKFLCKIGENVASPLIIAIDGPAGSGKSTVGIKIAKKYGLKFLSTGKFFRALAYLCIKDKVSPEDKETLSTLAASSRIQVTCDSEGTYVKIDGKDITSSLQKEEIANVASQVSAYQEVRNIFLNLQRGFAASPGIVAEGRDCGTVIFPAAQVKIYLTASLDARVKRRSVDEKTTSSSIVGNLAERDKKDANRKVSPMAKAKDAVEIDTSQMSIDEVVSKIETLVERVTK